MSIDFMSDEVVHHDMEEPQSKYKSDTASPLKSDTSVYQLLHSFLKQGNSSILNVVKKATSSRSVNHAYLYHHHHHQLQPLIS